MTDYANLSGKITRRNFLQTAAASVAVPSAIVSAQESTAPASSFVDVLRVPDAVIAYPHFEGTLPAGEVALARRGDEWEARGVSVESKLDNHALGLTLRSPKTPISGVHLRWRSRVPANLLILGDAWERSYGELGWRNLIPERVMPWYFAVVDGAACHAYGVKTDAKALCFWQLDPERVSLWLNVTNGGSGVELGDRQLRMATVVSRRGTTGEEPIENITEFCRQMCARSSRPMRPVYGANDWCYSYGHSTAETILHDTEFIVEVSHRNSERPFSVIDGGYTAAIDPWDWLQTSTPEQWRTRESNGTRVEKSYEWSGQNGVSAFLSP